MSYLEVQNNQMFRTNTIPFFGKNEFRNAVAKCLGEGNRMISLLPLNRTEIKKLIAVLLDSESSSLKIIGGDFNNSTTQFESWANEFPHTNYYECELAENYGYVPLNHPWLRPVRKQDMVFADKRYELFMMKGEEVHEVAVGPIHAGVIEPGHFRFQCHGETVYNLEISLGYQHRGVEKLMPELTPSQRIILAESIAGDTTIGNVFAHCGAVESLCGVSVNLRAEVIRVVASEIERAAMHLAGLGGIANDVGFALPASSYGRIRTLVINSLAAICGSRFGRGLFVYGGVRFDTNEEILKSVIENLTIVKNDAKQISDYLFSSVGALTRFEETGIVEKEIARDIGMTGLAARASGLEEDIRINFPYSAYRYNPISIITLSSGDVFARARLRAMEIDESLRFALEQLENLPEGEVFTASGCMGSDCAVVSIVEGWRGEIIHVAFTDNEGNLSNYKIKDPSFNNWYGLSLALRGTAISDFPLCNKSFDLSYAGHDL